MSPSPAVTYTEATADLSRRGRYRWELTRGWVDGGGRGVVAFVMLNPSTADGCRDDPTIRRCVGFARRWGFDRLVVVNLFAFRCTHPRGLLSAGDPVGGGAGDAAVLRSLTADRVVVAWGAWVPFRRDRQVLGLLAGRRLHGLGTTRRGAPRHPLYVAADTPLTRFPAGGRVTATTPPCRSSSS